MIIKARIEMPKGTRYKYEIRKDGNLVIDRMLPIAIPENYGYIINTYAPDGDALDAFIISNTWIYPTATVNIKILKVIKCLDQGVEDDKLIGVLEGDTLSETSIEQVIEDIHYYLGTYKPGFEVLSIEDEIEAEKVLYKAIQAYDNDY